MGNAAGNVDSAKEELGWLKVLFAVFAAVDASLIAWIARNYIQANRVVLVLTAVGAIAATAFLLWMNYTAYRKIRQLETLS
ncbi:MAG: hypothetical protein E6H54_18465 [Betaproteobacteria bacterium]|nr:MAG: hypothetical protein E6H54_18465 [Betaproteobacteria bacterium]